MSGTVNLGDDIGFVTVAIGGVENSIDLWEVDSRILDLYDKHKIKGAAVGQYGATVEPFWADVIALLQGYGFPKVSSFVADKFVRAILERVKQLKNVVSAEPKQDSADSTGSTASKSRRAKS